MAGLQPDAASRILRRAAELDDSAVHDDRGLSPQALRAAAAEVGISPVSMERAFAEERVRAALIGDDQHGGRLAGPDHVFAIHEGGADALARVDEALRAKAGFRRVPTPGPAMVYERRSDAVAKVRRAVRRLHGADPLERPPRVTIASALFGERMLVGAVADLRGERVAVATASGVIGVGGTAAAATLALVMTPWFVLVAPGALAVGAGVALGRKASLVAAQRELDGFVLTALEPAHPATPYHRAIRGPR